jgi:hypothetical protein
MFRSTRRREGCALSRQSVRPVRRNRQRSPLCSPFASFTLCAMLDGAMRKTCGHRASKLLLGILLLSILVFASCRSNGDGAPDAAPPPSLRATAGQESERAKDDLWRRAATEDPLDLARLADREGAGGLLEGLAEGGPLGLLALEALPFAEDAEGALQRLGEIVRQIGPGESGPVVRSIAGIAGGPRRQAEPIDPPGLRSCAQALLALTSKNGLARAVRADAISALRLLSEKGAVDPGAIPSDLDPR